MAKKVAIVGYTTTRNQAPYNDEAFEIWGLNDLYKHIPKYDRWFQLHTPEEVNRTAAETKGGRDAWGAQVATLQSMSCPIYMQDQYAEIPRSVKYPLNEIIKYFSGSFVNPKRAQYFTNSISYMIALAIYEGVEELHIYGVDMATNTGGEYAQQRPSCEFWLGVAAGRGIKLHIPDEADLLKTRFLYGYEDEQKHAFEVKIDSLMKDLQAKKAQAQAQQKQWLSHEMQYAGAETALKEIMQTWQ